MAELISYLAHLGIVRVLSVPIVLIGLVYLLWLLAAPPPDRDRDSEHGQNA
jgi:hypothetical protein